MASWVSRDRLEIVGVSVDQARISVEGVAFLPGNQVPGVFLEGESEVADKTRAIDSLAATTPIATAACPYTLPPVLARAHLLVGAVLG